MSDYLIGTTQLNMVDPETILNARGRIFAPKADTITYAGRVTLGNGHSRDTGYQKTAWRWGFLYVDQYDNFKQAYCPGASANVFIKTLKNDGTYGVFSAIMHWPEKESDRETSWVVSDVVVTFTHMVEIV